MVRTYIVTLFISWSFQRYENFFLNTIFVFFFVQTDQITRYWYSIKDEKTFLIRKFFYSFKTIFESGNLFTMNHLQFENNTRKSSMRFVSNEFTAINEFNSNNKKCQSTVKHTLYFESIAQQKSNMFNWRSGMLNTQTESSSTKSHDRKRAH